MRGPLTSASWTRAWPLRWSRGRRRTSIGGSSIARTTRARTLHATRVTKDVATGAGSRTQRWLPSDVHGECTLCSVCSVVQCHQGATEGKCDYSSNNGRRSQSVKEFVPALDLNYLGYFKTRICNMYGFIFVQM